MSPEIVATPFDINEVPENYLPESGYFFEANIDGDDIIREEATIKGTPIIHLSIADNEDRHSIPAVDLSHILILYQLFITYSLKKFLDQNLEISRSKVK